MHCEPLLAPFAKIEWANAEIENLDAAIKGFFSVDPYSLRSYLNSERTQQIWRFELTRKLPPVLSVRTGNILKNLREPLDNVIAAVSMLHRRKDEGVDFPFSHSIEKYEAAIQKLEKLLPTGATDLIRAAKTYPGGNPHLRALHYLNRHDKHRIGLVPINLRNAVTMSRLVAFNGRIIRVGFEHGMHMVPGADGNLVATDPVHQPMIVHNGVIITGAEGQPAILFEPNIAAGDDDMEVLVTTTGTQLNCDIKPILDVSFRNVPGIGREPIIITLHQTRKLVERILLTFRDRFFP
jgi:hypothetical protein